MQRAARIAFVVALCFSFVMAALPYPPPIPGQPPDVLLHMLAFATLGGLAAYGFRRQSLARLFVLLSVFGASIELVQAIPMLNRHSEFTDLAADMAAAFVSLALTRWAVIRSERRR